MSGNFPEAAALLGYCAVCLFLAGAFMSLYGSYRVTQEAGLDRLAEKYPGTRKKLEKYEDRWDLLRATMLLCAALMVTAAVQLLLAALAADVPFTHWRALLGAVLLSVLLTVFVHILPHAISMSYADLFSVRFLPLAAALGRLLYPLAWPLSLLERRIVKRLLHEADREARPSHEDEILSLIENAPEKEIEEEERELIKSAFEFGDTIAREVMTPRVDIIALAHDLNVAQASAVVRETPHTRYPVFQGSLDRIVGAVDVKDLLAALSNQRGEVPIATFTKPMVLVSETSPLKDVLRILRGSREHLALVLDEFGGTEGLISLQDIVEELIGDMYNKIEGEEFILKRVDDHAVIVDASAAVFEINEALGLQLPESDAYDSLGGLIQHRLGRIPRPGESLDLEDCQLTVQSGSMRRLYGIQVRKKAEPEAAP